MLRLQSAKIALAFSVTVGLSVLSGCASVVGARFDEAIAEPTQCDPVRPQTADPRSSKLCDVDSTCASADDGTGTVCAPLRARGGVGDACEYVNDCSPGLTCSNLGCVVLCEVGTACGDGVECSAFSPAMESNGHSYGFCAPPSCDPMNPNLPDEGLTSCTSEQCRFIGEDRTACFQAGRVPHETGEACSDDLDCSASDSCHQLTCTRLCRIGRDDCRRGDECIPGASDVGTPVLRGETFGHCKAATR